MDAKENLLCLFSILVAFTNKKQKHNDNKRNVVVYIGTCSLIQLRYLLTGAYAV